MPQSTYKIHLLDKDGNHFAGQVEAFSDSEAWQKATREYPKYTVMGVATDNHYNTAKFVAEALYRSATLPPKYRILAKPFGILMADVFTEMKRHQRIDAETILKAATHSLGFSEGPGSGLRRE